MTHTLDAIRDQATAHRSALLLGLEQGAAVVAWADALIHEGDEHPAALYDVSLTPADDLSALRHALAPLCIEPVPERTVYAMVELITSDLESGRRSAADTVRVLAQMRRFLPMPRAMEKALHDLEGAHMLAFVGIGLSVEDAESRVRDWLRAMGSRAADGGSPRG